MQSRHAYLKISSYSDITIFIIVFYHIDTLLSKYILYLLLYNQQLTGEIVKMNGELLEYIQSFGVMGVLILLVIGGGKYIVTNLSSQITDVHGIVIKLIDRLNQADAIADKRSAKFAENYGKTLNRFAEKLERLERIIIELKGKLDR